MIDSSAFFLDVLYILDGKICTILNISIIYNTYMRL